MALALRHSDTLLDIVARRVADHLRARVWVVGPDGFVAASSEVFTSALPHQFHPAAGALHFPLSPYGYSGTHLVVELTDEEAVSPRLVEVLIELVITQAINTVEMPDRQQRKAQFIQDLLFSPVSDEFRLLRQGQVLGINLSLPRAVLLVDAKAYIMAQTPGDDQEAEDATMQRRAAHVIASIVSFFRLPSDMICADLGGGEVAVLKASSTPDLRPWTDGDEQDQSGASWSNLTALKRAGDALLKRLLRETNSPISVGVGRYHPGVRGLARSYEDARAALTIGRHFQGANQMHCLDGLGIAAFAAVADERTKIDLARHLLSPLDHDPPLLNTLAAFFENDCSSLKTARDLCLHRNTLTYRLDKIASLTGLDPRHFDDAVQIRLALLLRSLRTAASDCASAQ